jgi:putative ABC transport system ATP-binding protein
MSLTLDELYKHMTLHSLDLPHDVTSPALMSMDSSPEIIAMRDIRITLGKGVSAVNVLKGVSLNIRKGEAVGLVGPSGSGKSTLLMTMAGLERADSGEIYLEGSPLHTMSEDELAVFRGKRIGIVFQSFHLIPTMTALENVALPLELSHTHNAFVKAQKELEAVGLGERLHHYPSQLSGGEQQRVAIARALAPNPAILVADEPTGNLDEATGAAIIELLFNLRSQRGTTLVLVTHDMELAHKCDRTIRLRSGHIEEA